MLCISSAGNKRWLVLCYGKNSDLARSAQPKNYSALRSEYIKADDFAGA